MAEQSEAPEIQGLLIPQAQTPLLLPATSVIEILGHRELVNQGERAPSWLLGHFEWRHLMLPLLSMERLLGVRREQRRGRKRIVVIHVFGEGLDNPFVGIQATGMPRMVNIKEDAMRLLEAGGWPDSWPVRYKVKVQETEALVPDLDRLGVLAAALEPEPA